MLFSISFSSNTNSNIKLKKNFSRNISQRKLRKSLIHSKFWKSIKMLLLIKLKTPIETWPSNIIPKTILIQKLKKSLLKQPKPMKPLLKAKKIDRWEILVSIASLNSLKSRLSKHLQLRKLKTKKPKMVRQRKLKKAIKVLEIFTLSQATTSL